MKRAGPDLPQKGLLAFKRARWDRVVGEVKELKDADLLDELLKAKEVDEEPQWDIVGRRVLDQLLESVRFNLGEERRQLFEQLTQTGYDEILRKRGLDDLGQIEQHSRMILPQFVQADQQAMELMIEALIVHFQSEMRTIGAS